MKRGKFFQNMKKGFLSLFLLAVSSLTFAQEPAPVSNAITHGPYLCDMTEDGVTVVWTTRLPSLSWVEAAPEKDGNFYRMERPSFFQTQAGKKRVDSTLHAVRVTGLKPGETYKYRAFSKDAEYVSKTGWLKYGKPVATPVSDKYSFTTFSPEKKELSFVMFNDIHGRSDFMKELCANVDFKTQDFVVFNGDMSSWVTGEKELFDDYMDAEVSLFGTRVPLIYTRGNHETRGMYSHKLHEYFPTRDGKFYQVYYDGGVCFLVLDCGEDKPDSDYEYSGTADYDSYREEEARWLAQVVQTDEFKNARARVVFLHVPPMLGGWHGNEHLQKTLMPILNKANITMMLSGHTHRYAWVAPEGETTFPTLVNGNNTYVRCTISEKGIKAEVIGKDAKENKTHEVPLP